MSSVLFAQGSIAKRARDTHFKSIVYIVERRDTGWDIEGGAMWTKDANIYGIDEICLMSGGGDVIRKPKGDCFGCIPKVICEGMSIISIWHENNNRIGVCVAIQRLIAIGNYVLNK